MGDFETIPNLFPGSLLDKCLDTVLNILIDTGVRVEKKAINCLKNSRIYDPGSIVDRGWSEFSGSINAVHFTGTQVFVQSAEICREFLSLLLAGPVLDSLSEEARKICDPMEYGTTFTFTVLCGSRLGRLVVHHHVDTLDTRTKSWGNFLVSPAGASLSFSCLSQLSSLSCLYLQHVASNDMLYVVANTCSRLVLLDISYSNKVTDIGLIHLCGLLRCSTSPHSSSLGCRYLRELYFNPQSSQDPIMPRVIACLLRHLPMLQVVDLTNLHLGIDHYYRGAAGESTHRQSRVKTLNLIHYTGSDKMAEVMDICPKLRTFKLFVTELLPQLGYTLKGLQHRLDHVTLVYPNTFKSLKGFQEFLAACGKSISKLEVECSQDTVITASDLTALPLSCPQLESIAFSNFRVSCDVDYRVSHSPTPTSPAVFPFLTNVRFANVHIEEFGKEIFRYLLGGAHDLETIYISFHAPGYFFSDFLLDDILLLNELAHLQEFILKDGSLTLISALRLISSRPKLRVVGKLKNWDVELSELDTFVQILRRAKSLNLLQDINIL